MHFMFPFPVAMETSNPLPAAHKRDIQLYTVPVFDMHDSEASVECTHYVISDSILGHVNILLMKSLQELPSDI